MQTLLIKCVKQKKQIVGRDATGTPGRKRKIKAREAAEQAAYDAEQAAARMADTGAEPAASAAPDAGGKTPATAEGNAVAAVRKEP